MTDEQHAAGTEDEQTEEERAADEALRVSDWPRWALAQRDCGALAQRFLDGLARHHPDTPHHPDTAA